MIICVLISLSELPTAVTGLY